MQSEGISDSLKLEMLEDIAYHESDPVLAESYADRLIELAYELESNENALSGYLQKGNANLVQGNLEEALTSFFKSLEIANELEDYGKAGAIYSSIANVYSISRDTFNSTFYYNKSIEALKQTDDTLSIASALFNAGDDQLKHNNYDHAMEYFSESMALFEALAIPMGIGYNLGNIGLINSRKGNYTVAERQIKEAISILQANEDYYPVAVYLKYLADIKNEQADYSESLEYAHQSLEISREFSLKDQISEAHQLLAELYEKQGNSDLAFEHFKDFITYRDSVKNYENAQELANMKAEFEIGQKQLQVDLLNQQKKNQRITIIATISALFLIVMLAIGLFRRNRFIQRTKKIIEHEKERSDKLLLNILPEETAQELKELGRVKAKKFESVTVLFTDFKGFTRYAEDLSPEELVESVDHYFSKFDEIIENHGLEKIKTVGDAYMCAGGLPYPTNDHAERMIRAAIEIRDFVEESKQIEEIGETRFEIRIGINTGPVVAGVVGTKKFAYDIWGDTVNIASRMESGSEAGKINISEYTYALVKDKFSCEYRGEFEVKNRGKMKMYFVNGVI